MKFYRAVAPAAFLLASVCWGVPPGTERAGWQPSPGHTQIAIWPGLVPDVQSVPGPEADTQGAVTNVTRPTMTVYAPDAKKTSAAVVVFPGGGFQMLAMGLEGTEVCDWLTAKGITCVLLMRLPSSQQVNIYSFGAGRPENLEADPLSCYGLAHRPTQGWSTRIFGGRISGGGGKYVLQGSPICRCRRR